MRLIKPVVLLAALFCGFAVAMAPADAQQPKKKRVAASNARTRVVVQPRSFLDAGTNVRPGERKFLDYAFPPSYGPGGSVGGTVTSYGNGRPGWDNWPGYNPNGPGASGWW